VRTLERVAAVDRDSAARTVLDRVEAELAADHPGRVQRAIEARVGELVPSAKELIVEAIQRQDRSHIDTAPRTGPLALEALSEESRQRLLDALSTVAAETGADLGVDAERNQATLRSLDPIGREVARQASLEVLERRLRAEEVPPLLLQTRTGLSRRITELGERAMWEMGITGRPELAELLGTLHYRFSYGQNALLHCEETGYLCAVLASELRMDPAEARHAGLLHDIGKAVDHDVEGSHAIIGGELLSLLGTDGDIVHAVKAHHFDEEPSTDLAMLTICADAISASRPGARRDTLTTYLQRLEQLQQIATRHHGVERAFPMQAGREVRISVKPETVSDDRVPELCAEIAREIEAEMTYPGMIKVTVIREISATATAS
jgi:ribonuclease Y